MTRRDIPEHAGRLVLVVIVALLAFTGAAAIAGSALVNSAAANNINTTNQPQFRLPGSSNATSPQIVINIGTAQNVRTPEKTGMVSAAIAIIGIAGIASGANYSRRQRRRSGSKSRKT